VLYISYILEVKVLNSFRCWYFKNVQSGARKTGPPSRRPTWA